MSKLPKRMVYPEVCGTCVHYRQHYILRRDGFYPLWYGHCIIPNYKHIEPDKTCPNWKGIEEEPVSEG